MTSIVEEKINKWGTLCRSRGGLGFRAMFYVFFSTGAPHGPNNTERGLFHGQNDFHSGGTERGLLHGQNVTNAFQSD